MPELNPALIRAYRDTDYVVALDGGEHIVRLGAPLPSGLSAYVAARQASTWAILSACNPYSARLDEAQNRPRHQLLLQLLSLHAVDTLAAVGQSRDGTWSEPSVFAAGIPSALAAAIGASLQQHAIVFGAAGQEAELVFCSRE